MDIKLKPKSNIEKEIEIRGDRIITATALILSAISEGTSVLSNFPERREIDYTLSALRLLGVAIDINGSQATVYGVGLKGLKSPLTPIETGNNTALAFLLTGLLAPQGFDSQIITRKNLTKGSFMELSQFISHMNGSVKVSFENGKSLICIKGKKLSGKEHSLSFYSPETKGALFLAGLYAENETSVIERYPSHNHMENLISAFGGEFGVCHHNRLVCHKSKGLHGQNFFIPGDIYDALAYLCAGILCHDSQIRVKNLCLNQSRLGFIYALLNMGAKIKILREKDSCRESYGDIEVLSSPLKPISLSQGSLAQIINELPYIITLCAFADGKSHIEKSDYKALENIPLLLECLSTLGGEIEENDKQICIVGKESIEGGRINCEERRKVLDFIALAALRAEKGILLENVPAQKNIPLINDLKNL